MTTIELEARELHPCWTCRHRTFAEISHSSQSDGGQLYRCVNCKAAYPEAALTLQPPTARQSPELTELLSNATSEEIDLATRAVEMNRNGDGSPKYQSAQDYACALTALLLARAAGQVTREDVARVLLERDAMRPMNITTWETDRDVFLADADAILTLIRGQGDE